MDVSVGKKCFWGQFLLLLQVAINRTKKHIRFTSNVMSIDCEIQWVSDRKKICFLLPRK